MAAGHPPLAIPSALRSLRQVLILIQLVHLLALAVLFTGDYPEGIGGFLVGVYWYGFRVEAYAGLLTGIYPPFRLAP